MKELTHVAPDGRVAMVDVSGKEIARRVARASGRVSMRPETAAAVRERRTPKGDPLEAARLAGIGAAKRTAELVPLCHPLNLEHVEVVAELEADGVRLRAEVVVTAKTGAEMAVRLEEKRGGRSGPYRREDR